MRQIEIARGIVRGTEIRDHKRYLEYDVTHLFRLPTEIPTVFITQVPLHETNIEGEVALMLETDVTAPTLEIRKPSEVLDFTIKQIKASKPNDRSEEDRYFQVLLTDLEKAFAYALAYLGE